MGLFTKIAVTAEATPVGSLNTLIQPDYILAQDHTLPKQQVSSELGYRQVYRTQLAKVSSFDLEWSALTLTELTAIRNFYLDHDGAVVPFNWTPQGETAARPFYFTSEFSFEQSEPDVYSGSISIAELSPAAFP
tara:strand:- start:465 stop:866 length:402 start_codon:yes stop_codon:yes gene_type:complete